MQKAKLVTIVVMIKVVTARLADGGKNGGEGERIEAVQSGFDFRAGGAKCAGNE